jgi:hypothetical protein
MTESWARAERPLGREKDLADAMAKAFLKAARAAAVSEDTAIFSRRESPRIIAYYLTPGAAVLFRTELPAWGASSSAPIPEDGEIELVIGSHRAWSLVRD